MASAASRAPSSAAACWVAASPARSHDAMNEVPPSTPDAGSAEPTQAASPEYRREIRSFVVRAGRMTVAQERAWRELWPAWGVENAPTSLDFAALIGREAPVSLEIGFGNG